MTTVQRASLIDLSVLRRPDARLLMVSFFAIDATLIVLHITRTLLGSPDDWAFDLGRDRSYGEFMLYLKYAWIAIAAFVLVRRRRAPVFAALGVVALLLLAEDMLLMHERAGHALQPRAAQLIPAIDGLGILTVQAGELLWFAGLVIVLGVLLVLTWRRSDSASRRDALSVMVWFAVMAVFAVGVDTVHSFFDLGTTADFLLTTIEDGGEMLAIIPAVATAFALAARE